VIDGDTVRFTTTHLETEELERRLGLQRDQVNELLATWCDANLPLVVTGDFNSDPRDTTTAAYGALTSAGFVDAWRAAGTGTPGFTCCQSADLRNATSALSQRVDQVFFRGAGRVIDAALLGADPGERTPSGLWPSDHAGVFATLRPLPPGRYVEDPR
jgi:endonuclease/exonuclease/phosphatase (EEP) superfamily protein YafD